MTPGTSAVVAAPRLLTPAEVAEAFRVDPKTVTRWGSKGPNGEKPRLASVRTLGGHRRYYALQIEAMLTDTEEVASAWRTYARANGIDPTLPGRY